MSPVYEWACTVPECSRYEVVIGVVQSMQDAHVPPVCVNCGRSMDRVFVTPPAVQVKGGTPIHHGRKP